MCLLVARSPAGYTHDRAQHYGSTAGQCGHFRLICISGWSGPRCLHLASTSSTGLALIGPIGATALVPAQARLIAAGPAHARRPRPCAPGAARLRDGAGSGRRAPGQALPDLVGDARAGQVGRQPDGDGGTAGGDGAVRNDHGGLQPEQGGAAVGFGVEPLAQLAQAAPLQQGSQPGRPDAGQRLAQLQAGEGRRALQRLQRDVPGEAVGHDDIDLPGQQVTALDVPGEADRQAAVRRVGLQQLMGAPGQLVALTGLGADGEQPDPGLGDAEGDLRVGHAELGKLDQHLGLGVRDGPGVEQQRRPGAGGQHDRQGRPGHPGQRPQPQPGGGDDGARRPGRHDPGGLPPPDQLAGDRDAGPGPPPPGQGALAHVHRVFRRDQPDLARLGPVPGGAIPAGPVPGRALRGDAVPGQQRPQLARQAGQRDAQAVLAGRGHGPGDDRIGSVVTAHGVHGHERGRSGVNRSGQDRAGRARISAARVWRAGADEAKGRLGGVGHAPKLLIAARPLFNRAGRPRPADILVR